MMIKTALCHVVKYVGRLIRLYGQNNVFKENNNENTSPPKIFINLVFVIKYSFTTFFFLSVKNHN